MKQCIDGVVSDMTPEEESSLLAELEPVTPALEPLSLVTVACAKLVAIEWDVTGVERSTGIAGAFMIDVDVMWVLFIDPQPDTLYIVTPSDGVTKHEEFVEVSRPGLTDVSFIVQRVQ